MYYGEAYLNCVLVSAGLNQTNQEIVNNSALTVPVLSGLYIIGGFEIANNPAKLLKYGYLRSDGLLIPQINNIML